MSSTKGLVGLTVILAIGFFAFFLYSNLSQKSDVSPPTAIVSDFINEEVVPSKSGEKVTASPSTTQKRPTLEGFKEKELKEGLDNIKAGLDLLQNPFE